MKIIVGLFLIFHSLSTFCQLPDDFPEIRVSKTGETAQGKIFLSVSSEVEGIGNYIFMMADTGAPIIYKKLSSGYAHDFKVQPNGLLSYAQIFSPHSFTDGGNCIHVILDKDLNPVDSFQLGNGYIADAHDFQLLSNGHALAVGYYLTRMDLSEIVDGGFPDAMVSGAVVQELDQNKNVIWQWRSWDHYDPHEYSFGEGANQQTVSEFNLNSINLDSDGNMLLGTSDWTKKINRQTGEIMWHLGGWENQFSFVGVDSLEGIEDVAGHAVRRLENDNVLIYDNGSGTGNGTAEAHEYSLDEVNLVAEKIRSFTPAENIPARRGGNAQRLPNGNTLVGWGSADGDTIPTCTEFDSEGNIVFEANFDNPLVESYRALKYPYPPVPEFELSEQEVSPGTTYDFIQGDTLDTGIKIKVIDLISVGYNELDVTVYDYAPEFPGFEGRAPVVMKKRIVLDKYSINYIDGELIFDTRVFNIPNPENITVYYRETVGHGIFAPVPTDYNSVKKEISASFDGFGEFILTCPDLDHIINAPHPVSPENSSVINHESPPELEWSQNGFFSSFELQVATDESFTNLSVDETELRTTSYRINSLQDNKIYYWRVKMTNDAGQSDWSDTVSFTTKNYPVHISPNKTLNDFIIYPNPSRETVYLKLEHTPSENCITEIIDYSGKVIYSENSFTGTLDISEYPEGIYLVRIQTGKELLVERLIIH